MGSWFVRYFLSNNDKVIAFDRKAVQYPADPNLAPTTDLKECVSEADCVFVCTPTDRMPAQIRAAERYMKAGAVIVEISSVKKSIFDALRRVKPGLVPVSLHPMFGPNASLSSPRLIVVPVRDESREVDEVRRLFKDARISVMPTAHAHDSNMGIVLGLTYFMNLALAETVGPDKLEEKKKVAGSTFAVQSVVTESILGEDPGLIEVLISQNPETLVWVRKYITSCISLSKMIKKKGYVRQKAQRLAADLGENSDKKKANQKLYKIISLLKETDR